MKTKVYIASSWKNQHAVEMLTAHLREMELEVISWVENNYGEDHGPDAVDFETWVHTDAADRSFEFDTMGAATCDLCIYVGPAGTDAWAEVGIAFGSGRPIIGLWAKGEPSGLMRKMMTAWVSRYTDLLAELRKWMVERDVCPECGSTEIFEDFGLTGGGYGFYQCCAACGCERGG